MVDLTDRYIKENIITAFQVLKKLEEKLNMLSILEGIKKDQIELKSKNYNEMR